MLSDTERVLDQIAAVFAELSVSFVVGGSIASSVYGFPRTTQDIDLLEDLEALSSPKYLKSIKKARQDYKKGRVFTHEEVFGEL